MYIVFSFLAGFVSSGFLINMFLKQALHDKKNVRKIIHEIYHTDYFPYICTIEGLLNLISAGDTSRDIVDRALSEVRKLKETVHKKVKQYEHI